MQSTETDSRHSHRMNPTQQTALIHGLTPTPTLAAVIDESFGGIGIAVPLKLAPDAGKRDWEDLKLTVEYAGVTCSAVIRHVEMIESGCRLGLEWKAQALSRCLRDLLDLLPNADQDLRQMLPGGLSMMWKLYEAERWDVMHESAGRLLRQISKSDNAEFVEAIVQFKQVMQETSESLTTTKESPKERVHTALDILVCDCLQALAARGEKLRA